MNHLCHIFLTKHEPSILFGNFIGDMITPKEIKSLPEPILSGIHAHYLIDHSIDNHPLYKECIQILRPSQRKYASVVMDIFSDFLLVDHWKNFHEHDYGVFKASTYETLLNAMPFDENHRLYTRIQNMIERDFLSSYQSKDRIPFVFEFLKKRVKFENNFDNALDDYNHHYDFLEERFKIFFPDLLKQIGETTLQNSKK